MEFLIRVLLSGVAVLASAWILKGVTVKNYFHAILVAIVLSVVNATIKPLFIWLTIPITIITLGLFLLVINALLILLVDKILKGFAVKNFWWALLFSIILSIFNSFLQWVYN